MKSPTLNQASEQETAAAMIAAEGNRAVAAQKLGVKYNALNTRLVHMRRKTALDFPDTSYRVPGRVQEETAAAMRKAKGDRNAAAKLLGIKVTALAARIHCMRRNAL